MKWNAYLNNEADFEILTNPFVRILAPANMKKESMEAIVSQKDTLSVKLKDVLETAPSTSLESNNDLQLTLETLVVPLQPLEEQPLEQDFDRDFLELFNTRIDFTQSSFVSAVKSKKLVTPWNANLVKEWFRNNKQRAKENR